MNKIQLESNMGNVNDLPDTLTPLSVTQEEKQIKLPWGRLYSCLPEFKSVDLVDPTITLGRAQSCTLIICERNFPKNTLFNISKTHFAINRDEYTNIVYLKDHSKNGTFVNGIYVGNGNKHILQHDDILSTGFKGSQKLFIFKLLEIDESNKYLPAELRKKYKLSRFLGKGGCGEVHLIFEKTTTKAYAIKKIKKGNFASDSIHHLNHPVKIRNEVTILSSLFHPCVITMKEIFETETDVFMILEYMAGGELTKRILSIQSMTEKNVKFIFYQIASAVHYLHGEGITHRDLKPDNVLLASDATETLVKITDFGLSKFLNESTLMETICGTPTYVAPEIIDGSYEEYSKKVDVWSLGVILFYMLCSELPFRSPDRGILNKLIMKGLYNFDSPKWSEVSPSAKDLVKQMLIVDPDKRFDMDEVLLHPWIAKDKEMQRRVSEMMKTDGYDSEYFVDDSENQGKPDEPQIKRVKYLETTL